MSEKASVQDYYGKRLTTSDDLSVTTVTQCTRKVEKLPSCVTDALALVHDDISSREFGCSTSYPEALEGINILDLGSGCGRDCFVLSNLVGEKGRVVGLDMTDELLSLAREKIDYHTEKYGYVKPNIEFVKGFMEKMEDAGLQDGFFDVIVSNCVISLCRDKRSVLKEAFRVLKPGGELYFSDMYRHGDLPNDVLDDEKMWCEGLIGALTYKDLHAIAKELGFSTPRVVRADDLPVIDEGIKKRLGPVQYAAVTFRLFKRACQSETAKVSAVTYKGGIRGYENTIQFDQAYTFQKGQRKIVDAELANILTISRFSSFFDVTPAENESELPSLDVDPFFLIQQKSCGKTCST